MKFSASWYRECMLLRSLLFQYKFDSELAKSQSKREAG